MYTHDLESLFQRLLHYRDHTADFSTLGPWLQDQLQDCPLPELHQIPYAAATYTRTCIAKEHQTAHPGFQALILRWDQRVRTPIHGHPAFSFYHVITGVFQMEQFTQTTTQGVQLQETCVFRPSETTWFVGQPGRYDNYIHRITCLEPGHTLHIYSEDAQQGVLW